MFTTCIFITVKEGKRCNESMEEEKSERKRARVNEWDRVLSISLALIDQQLSRSVTSNLYARKLQYCTALVVNEISSITEEEHQMKERVRR